MKYPANSSSQYHNYIQQFPILFQALGDEDCKLLAVNIWAVGRKVMEQSLDCNHLNYSKKANLMSHQTRNYPEQH